MNTSEQVFGEAAGILKGSGGPDVNSLTMLRFGQLIVLVADLHLLVISLALLSLPVKQLSSGCLSGLILFTVMVMKLTRSTQQTLPNIFNGYSGVADPKIHPNRDAGMAGKTL